MWLANQAQPIIYLPKVIKASLSIIYSDGRTYTEPIEGFTQVGIEASAYEIVRSELESQFDYQVARAVSARVIWPGNTSTEIYSSNDPLNSLGDI